MLLIHKINKSQLCVASIFKYCLFHYNGRRRRISPGHAVRGRRVINTHDQKWWWDIGPTDTNHITLHTTSLALLTIMDHFWCDLHNFTTERTKNVTQKYTKIVIFRIVDSLMLLHCCMFHWTHFYLSTFKYIASL